MHSNNLPDTIIILETNQVFRKWKRESKKIGKAVLNAGDYFAGEKVLTYSYLENNKSIWREW